MEMKLLIYEFICGGGLAGQLLPESLQTEGFAMLSSVVEDFSRIHDVDVVTTLDNRLKNLKLPVETVFLAEDNEEEMLRNLSCEADFTVVIAPESDQILYERSRWIDESGANRIGSSLDAIQLTADKFALGNHLQEAGVPTVPGQIVRLEKGPPADTSYPAVLKPIDGAGSQSTYLIRDKQAAVLMTAETSENGLRREALLQPYVPGTAVSVSFLIGTRSSIGLPACSQKFSPDGRFQYQGGRCPLLQNQAERASRLAEKAVSNVSGLAGYVGVDLVLGEDAGGDVVVEINPRWTTSYVGLRRRTVTNLAETLLDVFQGSRPRIQWESLAVSFSSDGTFTRDLNKQ